jgi:hypothetical protein
MPWCDTCGKKSPEEQNYIFESGFDGDYFCSEECRLAQRAKEE